MGLLRFINRLSANSELMEGMFARLGVRDWFADHPAGPEVLRRATLRCASCSESEACSDWLARHAAAEHAPGFCRNRDLIERIRREVGYPRTAA